MVGKCLLDFWCPSWPIDSCVFFFSALFFFLVNAHLGKWTKANEGVISWCAKQSEVPEFKSLRADGCILSAAEPQSCRRTGAASATGGRMRCAVTAPLPDDKCQESDSICTRCHGCREDSGLWVTRRPCACFDRRARVSPGREARRGTQGVYGRE